MKNIVVIGASSGIGRSLAERLTAEGYHVFGTYNQNDPPSEGNFVQMDITLDEQDFEFLPASLDGIAYCPGSINLKPFTRIKPKQFLDDYNLQVVGAVKCLQALLPRLKKSELASVVLFSTVAVQSGFNFHSQVAASKGALEGLTKALAAEWAPSIRVNCIAPSLTNTPLASKLLSTEEKIQANGERHPLKRIGEPSDISNAAEFLLSDKSSWITGQILHVDGGKSTINS